MAGEEPSDDDGKARDGDESSPADAPPPAEDSGDAGNGESGDDVEDARDDEAGSGDDEAVGETAVAAADESEESTPENGSGTVGEEDAADGDDEASADDQQVTESDGATDAGDGESGGADHETGVGADETVSHDDEGPLPAGGDATADAAGPASGGSDSLFGGRQGPEEDREMPLAEHIEEMLRRLAVVVAVAGLVSLLVFPFADRAINFLWYSIMPGVPSEIARPRLYGILEKLFTEVKVASLAGLIVALPVLVYETYAFMRPGLYPHERRYYLAAVPTSLVLAVVGVSFAYFVVLPTIFVYFLYYSQDVATIGFALGRTFDLILLLMGYMALVFQIPLFILLAMMMGLVTRRWLADRRLLFWGGFLGLSFLFSPDPTGMAPIIVAATMIVLFEGTLLLTKWAGRE